jgi:hypothetical protein
MTRLLKGPQSTVLDFKNLQYQGLYLHNFVDVDINVDFLDINVDCLDINVDFLDINVDFFFGQIYT